ncbi:DUF417 family protein [Flavobacterium aquidurense]|uniref:Membrane protein YkgB n=2 Tax=Flavobacterium TaxID=237 RepID=A0ABR6QBT2_9FLAO|nr:MULTISPECIES: DUF417 family protein [Flavobacterium]MBB4801734.1 putative membrane protein YkgB [Flavobacterium nitrogenifigens]MBB6386692.1 putative membrane protein YkgB [Flavobacterium notoginsengisoli]
MEQKSLTGKFQSKLLNQTAFIEAKNLPFKAGVATLAIMLLWAGTYKMTAPGAEGIIPLVENSPLISWHFKLFGPYIGSDLIGVTEWVGAILILIGLKKPKIGIFGTFVTMLMFFVTGSMLITTPETIVNVNGIGYMTFLGLFLFKDLIGFSLSLFILQTFRKKAIAEESIQPFIASEE